MTTDEEQRVPDEKPFPAILTIVGDIHGQYDDFHKLLLDPALVGFPSATNHAIFNGDLVDRGNMSVEVIVSVLLAKLTYPDFVHIIRGNHESKMENFLYGFAEEVYHKYDADVAQMFAEHYHLLRWCRTKCLWCTAASVLRQSRWISLL